MKYPIGIQTFEKLLEEGFLYVDKTELVYRHERQAHLQDRRQLLLRNPRRGVLQDSFL